MSLLNVFTITGTALHAQSARLNATASNLANADSIDASTGEVYRARRPLFAALLDGWDDDAAGVEVLGIVESQAPPRREYQPGHPLADAEGYVTLPNVDPVAEMADMIAASRAYQSNVEVAGAARDMLLRTLALGE